MMISYWEAEIDSVFAVSFHSTGLYNRTCRERMENFLSGGRQWLNCWKLILQAALRCRVPALLHRPIDENWSSALYRCWAGAEQPGSVFMRSKFSHHLMGIVWEQEFSKKREWQDLDLYQMLRERLCFLPSQLEVGCCEAVSNAKTVGKWAKPK